MTGNQINYWNMVENKRHNLAGESETARHNKRSEDIDLSEISLRSDTLAETQRSNLANEAIKGRSNDIDLAKVAETRRHNVVGELEVSRHNIATEGIESIRAESDQVLKDTEARLNEVELMFKEAQENAETQQSLKELGKIDAEIAKLRAEVEQAKARTDQALSDADYTRFKKAMDVWSNINGSVKSLGDTLLKIIGITKGGN